MAGGRRLVAKGWSGGDGAIPSAAILSDGEAAMPTTAERGLALVLLLLSRGAAADPLTAAERGLALLLPQPAPPPMTPERELLPLPP